MAEWPKQGSCGACGRSAFQVPSGNWWHHGRPCRAKSQDLWRPEDFEIRQACRFVPAGEPLPSTAGWHVHVSETNESGFPTALGACKFDHLLTVREILAREAEEGIRG